MVLKIYKPSSFAPSLTMPASKSISNRALLLNWLSAGKVTCIHNLAKCDDTIVMQEVLSHIRQASFDIHGAGTAMRFLTATLCITPGTRILTGNTRMQERPIGILVEALRSLGADITYLKNEGFPPLKITGKTLHGGTVCMKGNTSSQYVSALMMIGPLLHGGLKIRLEGEIVSRPYIEMTRKLMSIYGIEVLWTNECEILIPEGEYKSVSYCVESDWSAASYWYEMTKLWEHIGNEAIFKLKGLTPSAQSMQGDCAIASLMNEMQNAPFEHDFTDTPDLVPTMAVTCALTNTPFIFCGVKNLRFKETNRLAAIQCELAKLGVYTELQGDDVFCWKGAQAQRKEEISYLQPKADTIIETYDDHRMAMAFAPACIVLGSICIAKPEVVEKSYPQFWNDLRDCGFKIEEIS